MQKSQHYDNRNPEKQKKTQEYSLTNTIHFQ